MRSFQGIARSVLAAAGLLAFSAAIAADPLVLRNGTPTAEVEPNDTPATANALPAGGGWASGARDPALATEQDWRAITLNAGDTVFLSLDLDPERDGVTWNGRLGFALFGDAANQILVVDDTGAAETPNPTIPSEAMVFTVKDAGTYYVFVDSATAATGGPTATYHLNVTVIPRPARPGVCTVYTSADVPKALGPGQSAGRRRRSPFRVTRASTTSQ